MPSHDADTPWAAQQREKLARLKEKQGAKASKKKAKKKTAKADKEAAG